jgi:transposase-like protein
MTMEATTKLDAATRQLHLAICRTNVLERLNGEVKRRADAVAIFPNENGITRLVGAIPLE